MSILTVNLEGICVHTKFVFYRMLKFSFCRRNPHMVSQCCRCGKNLITHITWLNSTSWSLFKITHSACNQIQFSPFFLCVTSGLYSPSTFSPNFSWPYLKFFHYFDYFPHFFTSFLWYSWAHNIRMQPTLHSSWESQSKKISATILRKHLKFNPA